MPYSSLLKHYSKRSNLMDMVHISYWLGHSMKEGSSVTGRYIHTDTWKFIKNDVEILKNMQVA